MSKQSVRKSQQNYKEPKEVSMCHNCKYFTSETEDTQWGKKESFLRCGFGGFAVKKTSSCDRHSKIHT